MSYNLKRGYLNPEEAIRLVSSCRGELERLAIVGLLDTGLRVQEFLALKPVFFDFPNRLLKLQNGETREIPLSARAVTLFKFYFQRNPAIDLQPKQLRRLLERVRERAKILKTVTPTMLRHTYALACMKKKLTVDNFQDRIGISAYMLAAYSRMYVKGIVGIEKIGDK